MSVLKFLFIVFEVVVLFNLVILVHELGHFLAARWRGLKIDRFGIWFGKSIWEKKINGVVYCLGSIPAGGYVQLPQMAPMEAIEGKTDSVAEQLPPISALDKIIVAFAGPLFSFMLAFVFAAVVWYIGRPVSEKETTTIVGYAPTNFPAAKAGMLPGDKILEVDGHPVSRFSGVSGESVMWRIVSSEDDVINIKIDRAGTVTNFSVVPVKRETKSYQRKALRQIGVEPFYTPMIAKVVAGGPAEKAGLKPNDLIIEVNGERVYHPAGASERFKSVGSQPLSVKVRRGTENLVLSVTPEIPVGEKEPRVGIGWDDTGLMDVVHPTPVEQIRTGVDSMVGTFGALFSRKSDISLQHLSGPVGIMRIYYLLFQSDQGWRLAIWFSVILNINLAILNLLPIPVLDGGHITLALIEAVRRKPIDFKILNWLQTGCAVLVIGYILYVSFYDAQDLKPEKEKVIPEMKFSPKAAAEPAPAPAVPK